MIVLDTNVIVSGLRSSKGASFKLLKLLPNNTFRIALSPAIILEYEDVLKRNIGVGIRQTTEEIGDILDYICKIGQETKIYYLWRPFLKDASDDMVLELAVASGSKYIVTFNLKDFKGSEQFNVKAITPQTYLKKIGELK